MRFTTLITVSLAFPILGLNAYGQGLYDRTALRTIELEFSQTDWHQQLNAMKANGLQEYLPADMTVDGVLYPNVGVRYKGNSTYWSIPGGIKKPMNIDMNEFGIDQDLLGHSKLVLNNGSFDNSFMHEVIAHKIMNQFIPSSRANFVKVTINGDNYGIYANVEHLGDDFCRDHFGSADGFRYKSVPPWTWPDTLDPPPHPDDLALQDIGGSILKAERAYQQKNLLTDPNHHLDILDAIDALNFTSTDLLVEELDPFLDTNEAIWHLAINNAIVSLDAYYSTGQNYYLYHDPIHDRLVVLPWDYNMAFGGYGSGGHTLSPTAGKGTASRPLLANLVKGGVLRQEYFSHIWTAAVQAMDPVELHAEIDALAALIDAEMQIDTRIMQTYPVWLSSVTQVKNFIQNRYDFLTTHALLDVERPEYVAGGHYPEQPTSTQPVRFWVKVENPNDPVNIVTAHVRVQGAFLPLEMLDDGLSGDGAANDGIFAATAPAFPYGAEVQYYFHAKCTNSNAVRFSPDANAMEFHSFLVGPGASDGDVRINEFVASNNNGATDEMGEHEDWIELHNHGASILDLGGMYLTDDFQDLTKWQIPVGTTIAPDQSLLIWADGEPLDGPLHTNFRLSSGGEDLCLLDSDGITFLDFLSFGPQNSDVSTGRLEDSGDLWVTLPQPTPAASNEITCGVRSYNALDPSRNIASLSLTGTPSSGATISLELQNFNANQFVQLNVGQIAVAMDHPASGLTLLLSPAILQVPITTDANGNAQLDYSIPSNSALIGKKFYLQAGITNPNAIASHGLEVVICP